MTNPRRQWNLKIFVCKSEIWLREKFLTLLVKRGYMRSGMQLFIQNGGRGWVRRYWLLKTSSENYSSLGVRMQIWGSTAFLIPKNSASSRYHFFRFRIFSFMVEFKLWKWTISISWRKLLAAMFLVMYVMIHVQSY